jgi:hypothetical protein
MSLGAVDGMSTGGGKRRTQRNPTPGVICRPQIAHDATWGRTKAAAVASRRLAPQLRYGMKSMRVSIFGGAAPPIPAYSFVVYSLTFVGGALKIVPSLQAEWVDE